MKLRVASYNVHGCVGLDRQRSEQRIARVIRELAADVVGLQELDLSRRRSGGVDQSGLIAEELGWHRYFHPAMRKGDEHYGDALISRFPLHLRRVCELPGAPPFYCREKRGAIAMEVESPLGLVQIVNTHLGLGRRERLVQAHFLAGAEWLGESLAGTPQILMGDFNSRPGSAPYRVLAARFRDVRTLLKSTSAFRTFPTFWPLFAIDHIFINASLRALSLTVHHSCLSRMASDHFPLLAELALP